jgi:hypothetical protein
MDATRLTDGVDEALLNKSIDKMPPAKWRLAERRVRLVVKKSHWGTIKQILPVIHRNKQNPLKAAGSMREQLGAAKPIAGK